MLQDFGKKECPPMAFLSKKRLEIALFESVKEPNEIDAVFD